MKRLLNPKALISNEQLLDLPIIEHNNRKLRVLIRDESYNKSNGCQCYKDCDCYLEYGKRVENYTTYYRDVEFDYTNKAFYEDIDYIPVRYLTQQ